MRSAAFVRYGGADGMGHVGWAFDLSQSEVNAGAVENPLGTPTCDPATMGYWDDSSSTPMASMQQRAYNDLKFVALPKSEAEAEAAYRTAKWVGLQPYCAFGRNCLDDTYDVLRSYGVPNLPLPSRDLMPDKWFIDLDGQIEKRYVLVRQGAVGGHIRQVPANVVEEGLLIDVAGPRAKSRIGLVPIGD